MSNINHIKQHKMTYGSIWAHMGPYGDLEVKSSSVIATFPRVMSGDLGNNNRKANIICSGSPTCC